MDVSIGGLANYLLTRVADCPEKLRVFGYLGGIRRPLPVRQIARDLGLSLGSVYRYIHELQDVGLLSKHEYVAAGGKHELRYVVTVRCLQISFKPPRESSLDGTKVGSIAFDFHGNPVSLDLILKTDAYGGLTLGLVGLISQSPSSAGQAGNLLTP